MHQNSSTQKLLQNLQMTAITINSGCGKGGAEKRIKQRRRGKGFYD